MEEAVAVIAAHLGEVSEDIINNMSIVFFHNVLSALGKKINYESMSNYYGNSFAKDVEKHLSKMHPLFSAPKLRNGFLDMMNSSNIIKISKKNLSNADAAKALGVDFEGLLD